MTKASRSTQDETSEKLPTSSVAARNAAAGAWPKAFSRLNRSQSRASPWPAFAASGVKVVTVPVLSSPKS